MERAKPPAGTPEVPELPQPIYPAIESFIEGASPADVASLFADLKASLAQLKGAREQQGKKVAAALERTEELLQQLLRVREKLEEEKPGR